MRTLTAVFSALLAVFVGGVVLFSPTPTNKNHGVLHKKEHGAVKNLSLIPLAFTKNQGQWDDQVLFQARAVGATMWFTKHGAYYQFSRCIPADEQPSGSPFDIRLDPSDREPDKLESIMIKASFVGANPNQHLIGEEMLEYNCNYFIGNDSDKWRTDVSNYQAVVYEDIYAGIDLKYYGNGRQMEYDFIVSPGADPEQICVQYDGAKSLSVNDSGDLVVETKWTTVTELKPLVYQLQANERTSIKAEYVLLEENTFGFILSEGYNPELALVIDPVLSYSTYLGGEAEDLGFDIIVDGSGNIYITGSTNSPDFPTEDPLQETFGGGDADVFVTKLNTNGSELEYSTFLGGSAWDNAYGIAVDDAGCAYVTGLTFSSDFPTENPLQPENAGINDAFVTKLNSTGNALVYSTYLGGSDYDDGGDIEVDGAGYAYIVGWTYSSNFPTHNPIQGFAGGCDAFISKLSQEGDSLVYSTYLGGSGGDWGRGIALDDAGCAYVAGYTSSSDFPTENAYDSTLGGGWRDAFVAKLNPDGSEVLYSTYLGESNDDLGFDIAVDVGGYTYVTGYTESSNFPTENACDSILGGSLDAFVTMLNVSGNGLIFSTFLGGGDDDYGYGIAVDESGNTYVTGETFSEDFPTTWNAHDLTYNGGGDAFLTELNSTGDSLIYSTYLGGDTTDAGWAVGLNGGGSIYICGNTESPDFPTWNAYDSSYNGGGDAFITKINFYEDSLFTSSDTVCLAPHLMKVALSVHNQDTLAAMTIPLHYGTGCPDLTVDSVSFAGTRIEDWEFKYPDIRADTVILGLAADMGGGTPPLPPGEGPIAHIYFSIECDPENVYDSCFIAWDTTTVQPEDQGLLFVDNHANEFVPYFEPGTTFVALYRPGDVNGNCEINIADVVALINYLFGDGPEPCPLDAGDVNGDCNVDIADVVCMINYLFVYGPPPVCGCASNPALAGNCGGCDVYRGLQRKIAGTAQVGLATSRISKEGKKLVEVDGSFGVDVAGVQLEFSYDPEKIKSIIPDLTDRTKELSLFFSAKNGILKIGIVDLTGKHAVPAGEGPLVQLVITGSDVASLKFQKAILVDQDAAPFEVIILPKEEVQATPYDFALRQNYPNPFNPSTSIQFAVGSGQFPVPTTLKIYNVRGQLVRTLVDEPKTTGTYEVIWDGRDTQGNDVASGVYFYNLKVGDYTETKKMILMK